MNQQVNQTPKVDVNNPPEKLYSVYDVHVEPGKFRVHDVVIGWMDSGKPIIKPYRLSSDTPCDMPMAHGMKFLIDPGFRVLDENNNVVSPVKVTKALTIAETLQPQEVIADLEELSTDSLTKRAFTTSGGESLGKRPSRKVMIEFLIEAAKKKQIGVSRGSEDRAAELQGGQLETMFGGAGPE